MPDGTIHSPPTCQLVTWSRDRDAWLAARQTGIGASEIAAVMGESPWMSAYELWAIKTGRIEAADIGNRESPDYRESVDWGNRLEAMVMEVYAERSGRPYRASGTLLRSVDHPWALCTQDGRTGIKDPDEHPLEAKTTSYLLGLAWGDGVPLMYRLQVHQQMLVTGAPRATIACLIGGQQLVWCDIERDEQLIRKIVYHGERFWDLVQSDTPPPTDGSEHTASALARMYPQHETGKSIVIDDVAIRDLVEELEQLRADERALKKAKPALENAIKAAMGDAESAHFPGGLSVTLRTSATGSRPLRIVRPKEK